VRVPGHRGTSHPSLTKREMQIVPLIFITQEGGKEKGGGEREGADCAGRSDQFLPGGEKGEGGEKGGRRKEGSVGLRGLHILSPFWRQPGRGKGREKGKEGKKRKLRKKGHLHDAPLSFTSLCAGSG